MTRAHHRCFYCAWCTSCLLVLCFASLMYFVSTSYVGCTVEALEDGCCFESCGAVARVVILRDSETFYALDSEVINGSVTKKGVLREWVGKEARCSVWTTPSGCGPSNETRKVSVDTEDAYGAIMKACSIFLVAFFIAFVSICAVYAYGEMKGRDARDLSDDMGDPSPPHTFEDVSSEDNDDIHSSDDWDPPARPTSPAAPPKESHNGAPNGHDPPPAYEDIVGGHSRNDWS